MITEEDNNMLLAEFTKAEFHMGLLDIQPDKSPDRTVLIRLSIRIFGIFMVMTYMGQQRGGSTKVFSRLRSMIKIFV